MYFLHLITLYTHGGSALRLDINKLAAQFPTGAIGERSLGILTRHVHEGGEACVREKETGARKAAGPLGVSWPSELGQLAAF